jgi:hypothetical protein
VTWVTHLSMALRSAAIIALISLPMYLVTTFLFAVSGGQVRMLPVVESGFYAASAASFLLAAIVWVLRSAKAAVISAALGTLAIWVVAVFIEWRLSFVLGAGA